MGKSPTFHQITWEDTMTNQLKLHQNYTRSYVAHEFRTENASDIIKSSPTYIKSNG